MPIRYSIKEPNEARPPSKPSLVDSTNDAPPPGPSTTAPIGLKALARLAESIWRLNRRAEREANAWLSPILERMNDDLNDLNVEIIDRTGTPYRDGETMEKLHSDAPVGWTGLLIVTEVISPTIRVGGVVIEEGKVVVGPDSTDEPEEADHAR